MFDIMSLVDAEGRIEYLSGLHPDYEAAGLALEETVGTFIWDWFEAEEAERVKDAYSRVILFGGNRSVVAIASYNGFLTNWRMTFQPWVSKDGLIYIICLASSLPNNFNRLTVREREVMSLLALDKSTKEISEELKIGVSTVETHRRRIKTKLKLNTEAGLLHVSKKLALDQN